MTDMILWQTSNTLSALLSDLASRASSATRTSVAAAATNTQLVAAGERLALTIYNDSSATLYVGAGAAAVSTSDFTARIEAYGLLIVPVELASLEWRGIWSTASGAARITTGA